MNLRRAGILVALVALLAGATLARASAERLARAQLPYRVAALPAIPFLEVASLGYREAMADVAWLGAVQYYGEHRQGGNDLAEFRHYVDAVNALDPAFEHPYVFGAFVLATERGDLDGALDLLRRGTRANPDSPECPFEMGFLTYVCGGDLDTALRYMRLSAGRPGGRERALRFMAFLNRRLGRLETAWLLWNDIYTTTRDSGLRAIAAASLAKIAAELREEPAP